MTDHPTGTREEWLEARLKLLEAEKELTRLNDDLARRRRELPWVRIDEPYVFDTEDGEATLADLFGGRSQLIVYHFMYGPDWDEGCPSCSSVADGFDETSVHLRHHDVAFTAVSRAPLEKLLAYRRPSTSTSARRSPRSRSRPARRTTSGRSRAGSSTPRTCRSRDRA
jgi:predicted dithiol-disulfide oxidoreductase (DUF899 family)